MKTADRYIHIILVWIAAWATSCVGLDAFYAADGVAWAPYVAAFVTGLLSFALDWVSADRRRWVLGGMGLVAVLIATLVAAVSLSASQNPLSDEAGSWLFILAPMLACGVAASLLSRTLIGCWVWLVASGFACGFIEALYRAGDVLFTCIAVAAGIAVCVHSNVCGRSRGAVVARSSAPARVGTSVVAPLACVGAALVVWFAVLAPLNPATAHITLFEEYRRLPYQFVEGVAKINPTFDFSLTGSDLEEGYTYLTDDLNAGDTGKEIDARSLQQQSKQKPSNADGSGGGTGGSFEGFDNESPTPQDDPMSYTQEFPWWLLRLLILAIVVLAIVAFFLLRRRRRKRWLAYVLDNLSPRRQVEEMYYFLESRLGRIGFDVPAGVTLGEFARNNVFSMIALRDVTKVPFSECTEVYERVSYGGQQPSDEDCVLLVAWCSMFWKAARAQLGNLRYFFKSFRLNPPRGNERQRLRRRQRRKAVRRVKRMHRARPEAAQ